MHCPSCEHRLEAGVERCAMCGFHMSTLDAHYGADDMMMDQITDTTELLSQADREALQVEIDEFEDQFPQFHPAFYIGFLPAGTRLAEFSTWLLNRARVSVLGELRASENGFLFVMDQTSSAVTVTAGYFAEQFVTEDDCRDLLEEATPLLAAGNLKGALQQVVSQLRLILKRNHRLLLKSVRSQAS